jgi:hypothetical protein
MKLKRKKPASKACWKIPKSAFQALQEKIMHSKDQQSSLIPNPLVFSYRGHNPKIYDVNASDYYYSYNFQN